MKAHLLAFLDIGSELNRLDMRSCFRAWSMVGHLRNMAQTQLLIQSRQPDHYVLKSLMEDKRDVFYQEDMKVRRELGFSPFAHQVSIGLRGKEEKLVEKASKELHQILIKSTLKDIQIHAPSAEAVANKRGLHRLNILLQGLKVVDMISLIKQAQTQMKRSAKVIVTINVDP
jgi:primosomal protein N' (replication factor Y)